MKQMSLIEMDGFLKGKCIPRDLKVNETNAEYLVRKFGELESKLETALRECRSAGITIDNLEAKCAALAAENAGLKAAFDKPQAYLSWHAIPPTWEDPLPCGEYLDVHDDAGHKNSDGTDCWPVYAKPEIETPATDAFLAEVRAHDLNAFIRHHSAELDAHIKNGGEQFDEKSVRIRDIIVSARLFREQIRKEVAQ
ncbi:hNH endonuclease [Escherichia coli]|uniref:hNH endonuclease n=1 Tax=Escherichia coli TaxID=562 RepID=UPI001C589410|nr:hNH endonuclease [Escherichia coli]MBW2810079.1 hNH endonuclease [Escherichia coli]